MNKIEEFERNLKVAYLNYENDDLKETLVYLDRMLASILKDDRFLENDPFWRMLASSVFKAVILNNFYNKKELTGNDLASLLADEDEMKSNIKEFCNNFRNNELIDFINHVVCIGENPLKSVMKILLLNIGKMEGVKVLIKITSNTETGENQQKNIPSDEPEKIENMTLDIIIEKFLNKELSAEEIEKGLKNNTIAFSFKNVLEFNKIMRPLNKKYSEIFGKGATIDLGKAVPSKKEHFIYLLKSIENKIELEYYYDGYRYFK